MDRVEVVKAVAGQRIYFYPQEGRPTAAPSVQIKDQYGSTITAAATTYVTQDTTNTTVSVAGAIGDDSLTLTASTGVEVGKSYLMTNELGQEEWVKVRSINTTSKVVEFDEALEYVQDTAATFQATSFYYTLQTAEVDTLEELYRARATYTVSSPSLDTFSHIIEIPFDVVLTSLENRLSVAFVKAHRPDIMSQQFSETLGDDFKGGRNVAWDRVRKGIRSHSGGWRPALLRTPDDVEEWALAEFDYWCQINGVKVLRDWDAQEAVRFLDEKRNHLKTASLASLEFMDLDEDDSRSDDEIRPLTLSLIR